MTRGNCSEGPSASTEGNSEYKIPLGPHRALWASKTWIHKLTGAEMTIESDHKDDCLYLFYASISNPKNWKEKK